jgi:putative solute:sodium symporter small subunit
MEKLVDERRQKAKVILMGFIGGDHVKKMDRKLANRYFKERTRYMIIYFVVWFIVSYGVVLFAEPLSGFTLNGYPFHYFMGAQGAIVTFIILLFINASVSDAIDKKYGITDSSDKRLRRGKVINN